MRRLSRVAVARDDDRVRVGVPCESRSSCVGCAGSGGMSVTASLCALDAREYMYCISIVAAWPVCVFELACCNI